MKRPDTRYAKSEGGYVAWQVFGEPSRDILFVSSWATNVDATWDEPSCDLFFERLSKIGRVICFDKRGTGVSDPVPLTSLPTLEDRDLERNTRKLAHPARRRFRVIDLCQLPDRARA